MSVGTLKGPPGECNAKNSLATETMMFWLLAISIMLFPKECISINIILKEKKNERTYTMFELRSSIKSVTAIKYTRQ